MKQLILFSLLMLMGSSTVFGQGCPPGLKKQNRCPPVVVPPVDTARPPADTVVTPPPATTDTGFAAVIRGVRPRGFGAGTYTAMPGRYYVAPNGNDTNAGTSAAPFRTINKAAQVAIAGDVVTIRNGTYQESVFVKNTGTLAAPIVFQAENRGGVILTGGRYIWSLARMNITPYLQASQYIAIRGLIFRDYAPVEAASTFLCGALICPRVALFIYGKASIEDCLFERSGRDGIQIWGRDNTIIRTTFKDHAVHAFASWGPSGNATTPTDPAYIGSQVTIQDVTLYGNNTLNASVDAATSSSVAKLTMAKGMVIDNIESFDNRGHGLWFDAMATGYVVRNSYFHDNDASGLDLEISWGGLVENNVFARNGKTGLFISNTSGVEVRGNLFFGNPTAIEMADWQRDFWRLKDINIHHNYFKGWTKLQAGSPAAAIYHAVSYFPTTTAQSQNVKADFNTYDFTDVPPASGTLLKPVLGRWLLKWSATIAEMQTKHGWEANGKTGTIAF